MTMFSTFGLFIILSILLALIAAFIVIVPWLRSKKQAKVAVDNQLIDLNVDVYQSRLRELAADKEAGAFDKAQYQTQKTELERQLLAAEQLATPMKTPDIGSQLLVMIGVPIIAASAYLLISDRSSVYTLWQAQDRVGQVADDMLTGKIDAPPDWAVEDGGEGLISAMQTNVHHHANDPRRWMTLSDLFMFLGVPDSALEALSRAYRLSPENEDIATAYAQMSFLANGGSLDPSSRRVLEDILKSNPNDEAAQMLMAMGEAKAGNYQQAQSWVDKVRQNIKQQPGDHSHTLSRLNELSADIESQQGQAAKGVDITVTINASLLPLVKANDVIFVAIRDAAGGPPYAAKRLPISNLQQGNIAVSLSSLDAMMPDRTLQSARASGETLVVTARVSHSGKALSESGDLTSNPIVLEHDQQQVNIEINQQVP